MRAPNGQVLSSTQVTSQIRQAALGEDDMNVKMAIDSSDSSQTSDHVLEESVLLQHDLLSEMADSGRVRNTSAAFASAVQGMRRAHLLLQQELDQASNLTGFESADASGSTVPSKAKRNPAPQPSIPSHVDISNRLASLKRVAFATRFFIITFLAPAYGVITSSNDDPVDTGLAAFRATIFFILYDLFLFMVLSRECCGELVDFDDAFLFSFLDLLGRKFLQRQADETRRGTQPSQDIEMQVGTSSNPYYSSSDESAQ